MGICTTVLGQKNPLLEENNQHVNDLQYLQLAITEKPHNR